MLKLCHCGSSAVSLVSQTAQRAQRRRCHVCPSMTPPPQRPSPAAAAQGDPAHVLVEHVNKEGIDIMVLATRGRGPMSATLMGSLTDTVVLRANCACLVVKPQVWPGALVEGVARIVWMLGGWEHEGGHCPTHRCAVTPPYGVPRRSVRVTPSACAAPPPAPLRLG